MNADERRCTAQACALLILVVGLSAIGTAGDEACGTAQKRALARIPAVRRDEYKNMLDMQYWRNPYLFVLRDGVQLRVGGNGKGTHLAIAELPRALADLPKAAWPYGRIIGVQDQGLGSDDDDNYIRENHSRVDALLKCLRLEANWVPSA